MAVAKLTFLTYFSFNIVKKSFLVSGKH